MNQTPRKADQIDVDKAIQKVSRDRWAKTLAGIHLNDWSVPLLLTVVSRGESEYYRIAKPILEGHGFKRQDFTRIFRCLERVAKELYPDALKNQPRQRIM